MTRRYISVGGASMAAAIAETDHAEPVVVPRPPTVRPRTAVDKAARRALIAERAPVVRRDRALWKAHYEAIQEQKLAGEVAVDGGFDRYEEDDVERAHRVERLNAYVRRIG